MEIIQATFFREKHMSIICQHRFLLIQLVLLLGVMTASQIPSIASAAMPPAIPATLDDDASIELALKQAQLRKAIADADRAELLARAPLATTALPGALETKNFGAAGLVKAFDLARELAADVCTALPANRPTVLYDPGAAQGVVAARTVADGIHRLDADLAAQNRHLQTVIERHQPLDARAMAPLLPALVPATVKAVADLSALFKTDVTATGIAYGDGARALFATALAQSCGTRIAGLGNGYLGELDLARHDRLAASVQALGTLRAQYAQRIALVDRLADAAKGDAKKDLAATVQAAAALLKAADSFIESLRAGEASEKSPLFNAARYLGYAERTAGALVLDFDLRLEGLSIVKDNLFTGQHLRLSGVAFLWYRLHQPNGVVLQARALRRVAEPIDVDLRGHAADGAFWQDAGR